MKYLVICLLLLAACGALPPRRSNITDARVESWRLIEVDHLNSRIDDAAAVGEEWPRSPLLAAIELLAGESDARTFRIDMEANRGEAPDTMLIIITRDGFLDDSVRGDWHRVALHRLNDSTWRIYELRRAFRCWRGGSTEYYAAELCP
jgi:hypothetical protein